MNKTNLKNQLDAFSKGVYLDSEGRESWCYNFFDWFCKDASLKNKAKRLFSMAKTFIKNHPEIDQERTYLWFKNNCPVNGPLYDDFRIADVETGDVIFTVIPKSGHSFMAEVWGKENNFNGPIKTAETFSKLFKK